MYLSKTDFKQVIKNTPLIAIDLIVENDKADFLLGWRINKPARNFWFVPGGRIQKGEALDEAFRRIAKGELDIELHRKDAELLGVYEHIYSENVFDDPTFGTHYIVLGYHVKVALDILQLPSKQHDRYKWFSKTELLELPQVHKNTKAYFRD